MVYHNGGAYRPEPLHGEEDYRNISNGDALISVTIEECGTPPTPEPPPPPPSNPSAPSLKFPGPDATLPSRDVTFTWDPPANLSPDGYTLRVRTSPDMESGGETVIDTGVGPTEYRYTFDPSWDNRDLYWSVRACKPCTPYNPGPWAPIRRFRISPGAQPGEEGVYLCRDRGFGGCTRFTNDVRGLGSTPVGNDDVESIRIVGDWSAVLYEHDGFSGRHSYFDGSRDNLDGTEIGPEAASSMRVRKRSPARFTLHSLGDYNGDRWSSDRDMSVTKNLW